LRSRTSVVDENLFGEPLKNKVKKTQHLILDQGRGGQPFYLRWISSSKIIWTNHQKSLKYFRHFRSKAANAGPAGHFWPT
jgi:hypothetical protein